MRLASRHRERGGDRKDVGSGIGQSFVQRRKTKIIADRQSQRSSRDRGDNGAVAACISRGFPLRFVGTYINVKKMNLVVARRYGPVGIDEIGTI